MKNRIILLACLLAFSSNLLFAQNIHFITSGTVQYVKTVNIYALIKKQINKDNEQWYKPAFEAYQKNHPQFKTLNSTLSFNDDKTLFKADDESGTVQGNFFDMPMADQNNVVYNNFTTGQNITQKQVFEQTFLVKDSLRKIKWKITGETRDIAGYTCRRANGLMMDSIYVVAFFTDRIHISVGPESFNGLPGLILGVALPHENITWFATKVTDLTMQPNTIVAPKKGKQVDNKSLRATLEGVMKNWGDEAQFYLKGFLF